jgi:hypothetical protein
MVLRIALGALFAVVFTLPVGFGPFTELCGELASPGSKSQGEVPGLIKNTIFLLMPFAFGFSTSLVILVLNQIVEAIQTLFGRRPSRSVSGVCSENVNIYPRTLSDDLPTTSVVHKKHLSGRKIGDYQI